MDDIETRLRECTDACIKTFEAWIKQNKNLESRETLMESVHDVRKVLARVEIEIAISERDRLGSRPIPIPPHRSSHKRGEGGDNAGDMGNEEAYDPMDQQPGQSEQQPRRQQNHGRTQHRRPMHNRGNNPNPGNSTSDS